MMNLKKLLSPGRKHEAICFTVGYPSWDEAKKASTGYESEIIFQKKCATIMKLKREEIKHERDSVIFDEMQYSWPLLAGLLWVASKNGNRLNLVDFGGSLGTTYFQNRAFLSHLKDLSWNIVELRKYADFGRINLEDVNLRFYHELDDCIKERRPDTILLSGVLMYIEDPYALLDRIKKIGFSHILVDRIAFAAGTDDMLTVQKVPPDIYDASYPCWFFSRKKFLDYLTDQYETVAEFDSFDKADIESSAFKGFIFQKKR